MYVSVWSDCTFDLDIDIDIFLLHTTQFQGVRAVCKFVGRDVTWKAVLSCRVCMCVRVQVLSSLLRPAQGK